jgi:nitroreductase
MTAENITGAATALLAGQAGYLISMASRAPSVHNTQPWRFKVSPQAIELYADTSRKLHADPLGREMLISCGAAVFGLRLAVRSLGYLPVVELLPEPARLRLLARVRPGRAALMTAAERTMLEAVPHRHTHRGPFEPGPLPGRLLAGLQHDAVSEGATLALADQHALGKLVAITGPTSRARDRDEENRAELRRWTRKANDPARDGVPAHAFAARPVGEAGRLRQRDFDLGRGFGLLTGGGSSPPVTAVLVTSGDGRMDWLRAGQALHRLLLHAASQWVFAALYTQPLEAAATRKLIRTSLALPGWPQVLLQLGVARTSRATARRPAEELLEP